MEIETITLNQLVQVELAICEKIESLNQMAKRLDEQNIPGSDEYRNNVKELTDVYRKFIVSKEWKVEK